MKGLRFVAAVVALFVSVEAQADPPHIQILEPDWVESGLSPQEIVEAYPARPLERGFEGRVNLDCTILEARNLDCVVLSETPSGWGFGAAALHVAANVRSRSERDGEPLRVGDRISFPINFLLRRP
jgi:hypothetical protein